MLFSDLPQWLIKSGYFSLIIIILLIFMIYMIYYKLEYTLNLFRPLNKILPQKVELIMKKLIKTFINGLIVISNLKTILHTMVFSIIIWVLSALTIYYFLLSNNIDLPIYSSFVILFIMIIGISIPSAPGFLWNWQYACILALSIFNISKNDALAFSIVYYISAMGITILFGLLSLPFMNVSFDGLKHLFRLKHN